MNIPADQRYVRLLPDGELRYAFPDDQDQAYRRVRAESEARARREPLHLEADEAVDIPVIVGGRAVRNGVPLIVHLPDGRTLIVGVGHEAANAQEIIWRKLAESKPDLAYEAGRTLRKNAFAPTLALAQAAARAISGQKVKRAV